jgi:hypothetical protein
MERTSEKEKGDEKKEADERDESKFEERWIDRVFIDGASPKTDAHCVHGHFPRRRQNKVSLTPEVTYTLNLVAL